MNNLEVKQLFPAGHFYSPIPNLGEIRTRQSSIFADAGKNIEGIELNERKQLALLKKFKFYYKEMRFSEDSSSERRYYFENPMYSYADAIFLHCMIRHAMPKRIIEVGSGFSSAMMLDTNDLHFNGKINLTFIEPYPETLNSLLTAKDKKSCTILSSPIQNIDLAVFKSLRANDILFIDSTHVSKVGSDVNHLFFKILPMLPKGVFIHFHDIFYPFEYPEQWVMEGRAWNEAYLLRAFLQYNKTFEIVAFSTFLANYHRSFLAREMPLCLKNTGGSIWLKKLK